MKNISELLKNIMKENNLSVEDLSILLDVYPNDIYDILNKRSCLNDKTSRKLSLIF